MNQKVPGSKPSVWLPKLCTHTEFFLLRGWGEIRTSQKFSHAPHQKKLPPSVDSFQPPPSNNVHDITQQKLYC